jgi:glyoxylase-like metal-dependent hydrolase (beta-lactamase superfamily II)
MRELAPGLWRWTSPHPQWTSADRWPKLVASTAIDDGATLTLIDPLAAPPEILSLVAERESAVVLTAPWHERDTRRLAEQYGLPVWSPHPDTPADLVRKFGVTAEQARAGSPDLRWLVDGDGDAHWYAHGDRLPGRLRAFEGRENNDMVLWADRAGALIAGDTVVDFGAGLQVSDTLREGVTRQELVARLSLLLELPFTLVLSGHGDPSDRAGLELALAD